MGSIPACAGEPGPSATLSYAKKVYPRVCGGTCRLSGMTRDAVGLSPRVRGNPQGSAYELAGPGSIPACAGEPRRPMSTPLAARVYPRVCGGTCRLSGMTRDAVGLSPRVRGNRSNDVPSGTTARSIPACAGEPTGVL